MIKLEVQNEGMSLYFSDTFSRELSSHIIILYTYTTWINIYQCLSSPIFVSLTPAHGDKVCQ